MDVKQGEKCTECNTIAIKLVRVNPDYLKATRNDKKQVTKLNAPHTRRVCPVCAKKLRHKTEDIEST